MTLYKSKNAATVDVTDTGVISAKKSGHVKVVANVDGKNITANVEIASKNAYRAAKKEIEISKTKTRYSQARRMSAHYYDCSSIVWRTYRRNAGLSPSRRVFSLFPPCSTRRAASSPVWHGSPCNTAVPDRELSRNRT